MENKTIGERIRNLRGKESQSSFAEKIGVSKSAVAMYERGERVPRDGVKTKISKYFGVPVADIFFTE